MPPQNHTYRNKQLRFVTKEFVYKIVEAAQAILSQKADSLEGRVQEMLESV